MKAFPSPSGTLRVAVIATAVTVSMGGIGLTGCSRTIVEAPPPPQQEVVVGQPGPDYVWIGGFWGWHWGHYSWSAGHWEKPPHVRAVWDAPRWEHRGGRYVFVEGRWR
jgi:hypothetical protein